MKPALSLLFVCLLSALLVPVSGQSTVFEGRKMASTILKKDVRYSVYLPDGYANGDQRYPVVYLLHGFTDDDTGWLQFGEAPRILDEAMATGKLPPMIIIMPDGERTWYMNHAGGAHRFQDMLLEEMLPFVDKMYRTRASREFRGVAGLSMGGFGALHLSMRHPELFSACAAFSAAVGTAEEFKATEQEEFDYVFGDAFGKGLTPEQRVGEAFFAYEPTEIVMRKPVEELKKVRYYIDCGDDDWLSPANATLHIRMVEKKIPHEYRVRNGGHEWSYWRTGLVDGLAFIASGFRR